jgi:hypothetical protein
MKSLWTMLSVLAVANLLALGAFVGWLKATDRLSAERLTAVRGLFVETVAQQKAKSDEEAAKAAADQKAAAEKSKEGQPPLAASDVLNIKLEQGKADLERVESLKREVQILRETLQRERGQLDADRLALKKEKDEFERARKIVADTEGNAQFKKALATLEGLKPDKAKTALQQLIDGQQIEQVVAYLNAMQERTRTKIVDEFLKADPKVATDLLERLRTRGMQARASESTPG